MRIESRVVIPVTVAYFYYYLVSQFSPIFLSLVLLSPLSLLSPTAISLSLLPLFLTNSCSSGMILRTAESFGADGIVMTTSQYDNDNSSNNDNSNNSHSKNFELADEDDAPSASGTPEWHVTHITLYITHHIFFFFCTGNTFDTLHSRLAVRASKGSIFRVPVVHALPDQVCCCSSASAVVVATVVLAGVMGFVVVVKVDLFCFFLGSFVCAQKQL